jgi:hypothetical protein
MAINNTTSTYFFILAFLLVLGSCYNEKNDAITPAAPTSLTDAEVRTIAVSIDTALVRYINTHPNTFVWTKQSHTSVYSYLDSLANTLPFSSNASIHLRVVDTPIDKRVLISVGGYIYINRGFLDLFENETALLGIINLLGQLSLSEIPLNTIIDSIGQSYIHDLQIGANINNSPQVHQVLRSIYYNPDTTHNILNNSHNHFCGIKQSPTLIYNFLDQITNIKDFTNNFPYFLSQLSTLNQNCSTYISRNHNIPFSKFKQALQ